MSKLKRWMPGVLFLMVIWLLVFLAVRMVQSRKPSEATTLVLLEAKPVATENAAAQRVWITSLASQISRLDVDSRHLVLMSPRLRTAFLEMSPGDQSSFLEMIAPRGMKEFIEGSKGWSLGRYERLTQPALADLEALQSGSSARTEALLIQPTVEAVAKSGIAAFFKETDLQTRFDLLPFVERVQKYAQLGR